MQEYFKSFDQQILEASQMKWITPNKKTLKREYQVECVLKNSTYFKSEEEFLGKVTKAKLVSITKKDDSKIANRSHTKDFDELHDLISNYASYPEYRNEKSLRILYKLVNDGGPCDAPIVLKIGKKLKVFSGNTRMDIAFQVGRNVEVLIVEV